MDIKTALINASHLWIEDFGGEYKIDATWEEHMVRGDEDYCVIISASEGEYARTLTFDEICLMVENEMDNAIKFINKSK